MQYNRNFEHRFIEINDEQVAVTKEVYRAYKRPCWAARKKCEREARCRDENGSRCMKDCRFCDKQRNGRPFSLEQFTKDGFELTDSIDVAEFVVKKVLIEALYDALNQLEPVNRRITGLFARGLTEREIAAAIGLSQKGVNVRKRKIFAELYEALKSFR